MMLRRRRALHVNSLIPNALTVLALCAGMTSVRFALDERWGAAVLALVAAAIFDGLDGRMARLLKGSSKFGAELDSLSDIIAFGMAPAVILYLWSVHELGGAGWIASLAIGTCCALRLARFNTALEDPDRPAWTSHFFTGVAAPSACGFAVLPIVLSFLFGDTVFRNPWLVAAWMLVVAFLMISRLPTYSFKRLRVRREYVLPTLVAVGLFAAAALTYIWLTLACAIIAYIASMPLSYLSYRRFQGREPSAPDGAEADEAEAIVADDDVA